jgi:hypothetical protein
MIGSVVSLKRASTALLGLLESDLAAAPGDRFLARIEGPAVLIANVIAEVIHLHVTITTLVPQEDLRNLVP